MRQGVGRRRRLKAIALPMLMCLWGVVFLGSLIKTGAENNTTYNFYFALPVTILLVVTSAFETIRSWLNPPSTDQEEDSTEEAAYAPGRQHNGSGFGSALRRTPPEAVFAVFILVYLSLFSYVEFVLLSSCFIVGLVGVLSWLRWGNFLGWRKLALCIAGAAVFCLCLWIIARTVLGVELPGFSGLASSAYVWGGGRGA